MPLSNMIVQNCLTSVNGTLNLLSTLFAVESIARRKIHSIENYNFLNLNYLTPLELNAIFSFVEQIIPHKKPRNLPGSHSSSCDEKVQIEKRSLDKCLYHTALKR
jgi:hypothetical protein